MRKAKTIGCLLTGVLFILLILFEGSLFRSQPIGNLGLYYSATPDGFYILSLNPDSDAAVAGIEKHHYYAYINELSGPELSSYIKSNNLLNVMNVTSEFFQFGKEYSFIEEDGTSHSFMLEKQPYGSQLRGMPQYMFAKTLVALLSIICGMFCAFFYAENRKTYPLVIFLYLFAAAIYNNYTTIWESFGTAQMAIILFDVFGILAVSCLCWYILNNLPDSFRSSRTTSLLKSYVVVPPVLLLVKYLTVLCMGWYIITNPLLQMTQIIIAVIFLSSIILFIYMLVRFPGESTMLFRFLLLGTGFSCLPVLFVLLRSALSSNFFMSAYQILVSIYPLVFLPLMLVMCIIQTYGVKKDMTVSRIVTWFGYLVVAGIVVLSARSVDSEEESRLLFIVFIVASPFIYTLLKVPVNRFLSSQFRNEAEAEFSRKLVKAKSKQAVYEMTANEIISRTGSSFVFFFDPLECGSWDIAYSTPVPLTGEELRVLISEGQLLQKKNPVVSLSDGSLLITNQETDEKMNSYVFIGRKANGDAYIQTERELAENIVKIFFKQEILDYTKGITRKLADTTEKIIQLQNDTIVEMANLIENRDGSTGQHAKRTSMYSRLLAEKTMEAGLYSAELNPHFVELIGKAAPMHDVGKITISDVILKKPGKLTDEERAAMEQHTTVGRQVVMTIMGSYEDHDYVNMAAEIATHHHERWDGTGYPEKLSGLNIPLSARIMAVADVFDALVSPRCYKRAWDDEEAFAFIAGAAGSQFDPALVRIFLANRPQILEIKNLYHD